MVTGTPRTHRSLRTGAAVSADGLALDGVKRGEPDRGEAACRGEAARRGEPARESGLDPDGVADSDDEAAAPQGKAVF